MVAMPAISVFTPSHDPKYLAECYDSLLEQTFEDWEWVILLNGPKRITGLRMLTDKRVRVCSGTGDNIGALKRLAVSFCTGELLVELDHDDLLLPDALEELRRSYIVYPRAALFYSDTAQINEDGSPNEDKFDVRHGWDYYKAPHHAYLGVHALAATPHNVSNIWYAPNHVRAFPRWAYDQAGGYDPSLEVCDDLDLMCRLYRQGSFVYLPEVLYLQRVHAGNTQKERNALIQTETLRLYDHYIEGNTLAWAGRNGLRALDLGGAHNSPPGYESVDLADGADIQRDVRAYLADEVEESSVGVIRASDFLEHVPDPVSLMNLMHRALAPNGLLLSCTPSTDGRGGFQDPTHVSFWNANSFWYYTRAEQAKYVPRITGKWQVSRIVDFYPSDWHRENLIPYVQANLIPIKDGGFRDGGLRDW
jgi:glycosyltransferase involved in cell wall biosynthesis